MFEPRDATVIIVDDEPDLREALEVLVETVGYRCRSFAASDAFLAVPFPRTPCCLVLDLQLEGLSGLELQNELNARNAAIPVLFLSGNASIAQAVNAMKAGALDFLQKPVDPELLLRRIEHALRTSANGYNSHRPASHDAALVAGLSSREHEILTLLADDNTASEIARILDTNSSAVETHCRQIMDKLKGHTLADLAHSW